MSNHGSLREHKTDMDVSNSSTSSCGFRGCFRTSGSRNNNGHERQHFVQQEGGGRLKETTWWKKKLTEAKNRLCRNKKQKKATSYDIDSYALNFDEARFADPFTNEDGSIGREVRRTDESAFIESRC
ncbi:unnamed protein product [Malus baccata var. baccata]